MKHIFGPFLDFSKGCLNIFRCRPRNITYTTTKYLTRSNYRNRGNRNRTNVMRNRNNELLLILIIGRIFFCVRVGLIFQRKV